MQFSRCALFTKATPTNYTICHDFNCHINERETSKTCLTNHKGSISHHIMPLVFNSLGGGHTHTHTHIHCGQKQFQETSHASTKCWCTLGLNTPTYTHEHNIINPPLVTDRMFLCVLRAGASKI